MRSQKISFKGAYGDELAAYLDLPDNDVQTYALFAHCFTCSKNLKPVQNISRTLIQRNIGVLRFDFTGLGESEGDFSDTNFSSNVNDLLAATRYLEKNHSAPEILIGHSLGGAAMLQVASQIEQSKAVVTIAAPSNPKHVKKNFGANLQEIRSKGEATVTLAGRDFKIKKQFLDDLEETRMDENIRNLDRALMIFHSPIDQTVSIENAAHIYEMAKHPKSFVSLDDADHLLMKEKDSIYLAEVLASWAKRYFGQSNE